MALGSFISGAVRHFGDALNSAWEFSKDVINPAAQNREFNSAQAALERDFNASEAEKARQFNSLEAQKQRDWEEKMSGSAYQRAAADMRAAGLNPYMVYGGASAASTPAGSSASGPSASSPSARVSNTSSLLSTLVSSAFMLGATRERNQAGIDREVVRQSYR